MNAAKTYECLSCRLKGKVRQQVARRHFHASMPAKARKRYPNVKASDLEQPHFRAYTSREKQLLAIKYTPEQMKVIEAGEEAVSAEDMAQQGRMRTDPMRIQYPDDFATLRPELDQPLSRKDNMAVEKPRGSIKAKLEERSKTSAESDPQMHRLMQQTGLSKEEISKIKVKNLVSHRVVNQTRMGKIQSLYFLSIAGDGNGMVGIGEGKSAEDEDARKQAMMNAIRNMKPIPRYEERTIYGEVEGKVGAAVVQLSARGPGT
jgi:small subunit ribosomal protein S5